MRFARWIRNLVSRPEPPAPHVPKVIRIEWERGAEGMLVDGVRFPWYIAEHGPLMSTNLDGLPIVWVPVLTDHVIVRNESGIETHFEGIGSQPHGSIFPVDRDASRAGVHQLIHEGAQQ